MNFSSLVTYSEFNHCNDSFMVVQELHGPFIIGLNPILVTIILGLCNFDSWKNLLYILSFMFSKLSNFGQWSIYCLSFNENCSILKMWRIKDQGSVESDPRQSNNNVQIFSSSSQVMMPHPLIQSLHSTNSTLNRRIPTSFSSKLLDSDNNNDRSQPNKGSSTTRSWSSSSWFLPDANDVNNS